MRTPALLLLAAIAAAPLAAASAQRTGTTWVKTLARPAVELAEPFSAIGGVRELSDGRVLVVDRREKAVRIVDLDAGTATQVGREGSGPGEYGLPMMLMPLPGDSTLLFDGMNARYLVIDPAGKITGSMNLLGEGRGLGLGLTRGVDGAGRLYFLDRGLRGGPGVRPQSADSGALVRYDRERKRIDTVAYVRLPKMNVQRSGGGGQVQVRVSGPAPFTPQDEFAIGQDGRIALVHVDDYHVEWIAPGGQRVQGKPNPFTPIRVTDVDREQLREARQRGGGTQVVMRVGGGGPGGGSAPPPTLAPPAEPADWPELKPPFSSGAAVIAPDGALWVLRTREATDPVPTYDVFDSFGARVGKVVLPRDARLVGFGRTNVYLVRRDADDLEYLQRFAL